MGVIKTFIAIILIVVAVFFGFRLLTPEDSWICEDGSWKQHGKPSSPMPNYPCEKPTTTSSPTISPTTALTNLKEYSNTDIGFSTKYSPEVKVTENLDGTVTFSRWGPTQKIATELFDGFSININQGIIGANKDLKSLIEADIEQNTEQLSPDFKVTVPISPKYNGFTYKADNVFGEVTYYYLPQTNDKFLLISSIVRDPGNLGFDTLAESIILAINITK